MADISGGQMNLTVNQMRIANEIIWPSKVIFGFMTFPAKPVRLKLCVTTGARRVRARRTCKPAA
jgi:hypothetical protein